MRKSLLSFLYVFYLFITFSFIFCCGSNSEKTDEVAEDRAIRQEEDLSGRKEMLDQNTQSSKTKTGSPEPNTPQGPPRPDDYREVSLFSGQVTLWVPNVLELMSDDLFRIKYPLQKRVNTEAFCDESDEISLLVEKSNRPASDDQLTGIEQSIVSEFRRNPGIELLQHQLLTVNDRRFVVVEFMSQAIDTKIYNYMFVTALEGRALVGNFNCTERYLAQWKRKGQEILASIEIKY